MAQARCAHWTCDPPSKIFLQQDISMNRLVANTIACFLVGLLSMLAMAHPSAKQWIGTWATAPQPPEPGHVKSFRNQTLRLIVHISTGGTRVRIKISNI